MLCREAQDNGDYARAFWLCASCCRTMQSVASLKVAQQLNATINHLYEDTISRLEGALQSVCNDFRHEQYTKVGVSQAEQSLACCLLARCLLACIPRNQPAW